MNRSPLARHRTSASLVMALILVSFLLPTTASSAENAKYDLLIVRDGWGRDNREAVRPVLESAADELWRHFPGRKLRPIIVYPKGGPIVLFDRGPKGEIVMQLATGDVYWSQYVYQFAHEFCHILCRYDSDPHGQQWFEESLCEMASLFVLRRLSDRWAESKRGGWRKFAPNHKRYADRLIDGAQLPEGVTLAQWYEKNAKALRKSATSRALNRVAAVRMLERFEAKPEHWEAVTWLNKAKPTAPQTLSTFLADWHRHVPAKHKAFVEALALEFGVKVKEQETQKPAERASDESL